MASTDLTRLPEGVVNEAEMTIPIPAASSLLLGGTLAGSLSDYSSLLVSSLEAEMQEGDPLGVVGAETDGEAFYIDVRAPYRSGRAKCIDSELNGVGWGSMVLPGSYPALVERFDCIGSSQRTRDDAGWASIKGGARGPTGVTSISSLIEAFVLRSIVNRSATSELVERDDAPALTSAWEPLALTASEDERLDSEARLEQLLEAATSNARQDGKDLLNELALQHGLAWQTIATMLGVTSAAIRKWRRGGSMAPENREQLAALATFFEQLEGAKEPIADLGSWVEMRVREDTTLTPAEIYRAGPRARLLLVERANGEIDTATMLGRFDDSWRENYARDPNFRVGVGPDGERSIVPR